MDVDHYRSLFAPYSRIDSDGRGDGWRDGCRGGDGDGRRDCVDRVESHVLLFRRSQY
jgi:hypothetical protein